jgi:type II secretory pathway pseudopilin PulG
MLNKKGFTIAEVIVSFSLVSIILASMVATMMYYRSKVKDEEVITQLIDFKNTVTIAVNNDIIYKGFKKVDNCLGTSNCVVFTDKDDNSHVLKIVEYQETVSNIKKGVYISYDDVKYMLPDSDLGSGSGAIGEKDRVCDFIGGFEIKAYDNKLYRVKTSFYHQNMEKKYDLIFLIQSN